MSRVSLVLTLLFVLAAVTVSTGLVVYTAWNHELGNGLFALLLAVLSAKAAFAWLLWRIQPVSLSASQQDLGNRKPADEPTR